MQKIDFYKAAHHGSRYSNSTGFLEALAPEIALVSCSRTNRYGHPPRRLSGICSRRGARCIIRWKAADCASKRRTDKPSAGGIWKKKNSGGSEFAALVKVCYNVRKQ